MKTVRFVGRSVDTVLLGLRFSFMQFVSTDASSSSHAKRQLFNEADKKYHVVPKL
jgi:hypothetical protein